MPFPDIIRIEGCGLLKNLFADRILLCPYIVIAIWIVLSLLSFYEPWMKISSVINDEIRYDLDTTFMCFVYKYFKILNSTVIGIDVFVVDHMIFVIRV